MYEERQHYTSLATNTFLGIYVLGLIPALLIAGALSDRHGRKPLAIASVLASLLGSGLLALGPLGAAWIITGRLLSGVAVGIAMSVGTTWVTELSRSPHDPTAEPTSGARRAALGFTIGSGIGALNSGVLAQWGPAPEVTPYLVHIIVTIPLGILLLHVPETRSGGHGTTGPLWHQLRVPSAGHRRFTRVVAWCAPWLFASAAIGYGYMPPQLHAATGDYGLAYAAGVTVLTLAVSTFIQPLAKRLHSLDSARGLIVALLAVAAGVLIVAVAIAWQSPVLGVAACIVIGAALGIGLVSGLLETQRIATPEDLATLTGVFYAIAYAGFLAPSLISALAQAVNSLLVLAILSAGCTLIALFVLGASGRHLPDSDGRTEDRE